MTFQLAGPYAVQDRLPRTVLIPDTPSRVMVRASTAALGMFTVHRNFDYQSDPTIWQDTVAKVPHDPRAHYNLGATLAGRGQVEEAIAQYQKAVEIKPDYAAARRNLESIRASRK